VVAFTEIAQTLVTKAREIGDPLVVTFGSVKPVPGVVNVVPGEVEFSVDTRHIDEKELNDFAKTVESTINEVADKYGMTADINLWMERSEERRVGKECRGRGSADGDRARGER